MKTKTYVHGSMLQNVHITHLEVRVNLVHLIVNLCHVTGLLDHVLMENVPPDIWVGIVQKVLL